MIPIFQALRANITVRVCVLLRAPPTSKLGQPQACTPISRRERLLYIPPLHFRDYGKDNLVLLSKAREVKQTGLTRRACVRVHDRQNERQRAFCTSVRTSRVYAYTQPAEEGAMRWSIGSAQTVFAAFSYWAQIRLPPFSHDRLSTQGKRRVNDSDVCLHRLVQVVVSAA